MSMDCVLFDFATKNLHLATIFCRGGKNCNQLCRGMGIPCRLVFSCSTKVKIDRLKELLKSKTRQ